MRDDFNVKCWAGRRAKKGKQQSKGTPEPIDLAAALPYFRVLRALPHAQVTGFIIISFQVFFFFHKQYVDSV